MAKPICVINVDMDADLGNGQRVSLRRLQEAFDIRLSDYHVFVLPSTGNENELFKFQVFYEKDFTDIQYQELRSLIEESIKHEHQTQ